MHLKIKVGRSTSEKQVIISRSKKELLISKIDPCGACGRRVMANSIVDTKCGNWVHGRCATKVLPLSWNVFYLLEM